MAGDESEDEELPPGLRDLARELATVDAGSSVEVELGDLVSGEYKMIPGHAEQGMRGTSRCGRARASTP
jgi:hypothetical protein